MTTAPTSPRTAFFSWLFLLGLLGFCCTLGIKWMKWPGGSPLLVITGLLTIVGSFVQIGLGSDRHVVLTMRMAIASMVIYCMWRLLYWPGSLVVAIGAVVVSAVALLHWWRHGQASKGALVALLFFVVGGAAMMVTPVHALYGYMMLETPGAKRFIHSGVGQWYRYSWLLYQDGQYAKSTVMIDSAKAIVSAHHARTGISGERLLAKLDSTRGRIQAHDWDSFQELAK